MPGKITLHVGSVPSSVSNKVFSNMPSFKPVDKDTELPSRLVLLADGGKQIWSVTEQDFVVGGLPLKYPAVGIVNLANLGPDGVYEVFASTITINSDLRPGEPLHLGGFVVTTSRVVKAGETVPALLLLGGGADTYISIEAAPASTKSGETAKPGPLLTIFDEHMKLADRTIAVEIWRKTNKSVRE